MIERAQPWLGTLVSIRIEGLPSSQAHRAMDAAFAEVAAIHRLMSFHESASDVSRLNRDAARRPVTVHPHTLEVLKCALTVSALSHGCFDISVGARLVKWGFLPRPVAAPQPQWGSWRDIELQPDGRISFHRALWIDLGGIAKGYAVDRAVECLRQWGAEQVVVNAGGDLCICGPRLERVGLKVEIPHDHVPVVELKDGCLASSCGHGSRHWRLGRLCGPHIDGVRRTSAPTDRFVCVLAEQCILADALTKVVMAMGTRSVKLLQRFGASAHLHDPVVGWQHLGKGSKQP